MKAYNFKFCLPPLIMSTIKKPPIHSNYKTDVKLIKVLKSSPATKLTSLIETLLLLSNVSVTFVLGSACLRPENYVYLSTFAHCLGVNYV